MRGVRDGKLIKHGYAEPVLDQREHGGAEARPDRDIVAERALGENAGHDPAYRLGPDGVVTVEGPQGIALGVNPAFEFQTGELRLAPGEALYLYTDGITEAMAPDDGMFGKERLEERLRGLTGAPLDRVISETVQAVREFAATCPQSDDITGLALRLLPGV